MSDVEDLYVSEETQELEIDGVTIKYEEMSGTQFAELTDELDIDPNNPQSTAGSDYFEKIIDECVIEPDLDVERLKSGYLVKIVSEIQGSLGAGERAENLG